VRAVLQASNVKHSFVNCAETFTGELVLQRTEYELSKACSHWDRPVETRTYSSFVSGLKELCVNLEDKFVVVSTFSIRAMAISNSGLR